MKNFVVLAIVIISVQGSSIVMFREILDNGRESDANRVRTKLKNILTLVDDSISPGNNDDDSSSIVGDRGEIMSGNILEELQNIETLEDIIRFLLDKKELLDCQGSTCNMCYLGLCLNLVYQAVSKQFEVSPNVQLHHNLQNDYSSQRLPILQVDHFRIHKGERLSKDQQCENH